MKLSEIISNTSAVFNSTLTGIEFGLLWDDWLGMYILTDYEADSLYAYASDYDVDIEVMYCGGIQMSFNDVLFKLQGGIMV